MNDVCYVTHDKAVLCPQANSFIWANMVISERWSGVHGAEKVDYDNMKYWLWCKDQPKYRNSVAKRHKQWAGIR
jgi:hypothetical protein